MSTTPTGEAGTTPDQAVVERTSDRETVATRVINGPRHLVFRAWTDPVLFQRWWIPKSFPITLLAVEMDVRVGGGYKLTFTHEGSTIDFFGRYLEVVPDERLAWTNEEGGEGGAVTTVTFEDLGGRTRVVIHDLHASKEALDAEIGSTEGMPETLAQLDEVVVSLAAGEAGPA
ncbi:MAG: SRPBCC domain-containing protein [Chloroflexota bacterium]